MYSPNRAICATISSGASTDFAPLAAHELIRVAVFFLMISKYFSSVMASLRDSFIGSIHHIVMDQGSGMQHFNQGGSYVRGRSDVAGQFGRQKNQDRPDLFAF